ncbi:unnamed protein product [Tilletia controversa]|nr:unnamed protein product [Tilletia controversa]
MFVDIGLFIELQACISAGDPGRLVIAMKQLVPRFQATGQHNYVSELLEILVTLHFESPPALRAIMLASLLVNTKGHADSFMPTDLLQENFVFDLKHTWPVGGTPKSLQYKGFIGSLLQILADLKFGFWKDLGIAAQNQTHSDKKRASTIQALQGDFDRGSVFEWHCTGRQSNAFELIRGEAVRVKRAALQASGESTKSARQLKNIACDLFASGMLALQDTASRSGAFARWCIRRAAAMGKEREDELSDEASGDEDMEGDNEGMFSYVGMLANLDGVQELEDDEL